MTHFLITVIKSKYGRIINMIANDEVKINTYYLIIHNRIYNGTESLGNYYQALNPKIIVRMV